MATKFEKLLERVMKKTGRETKRINEDDVRAGVAYEEDFVKWFMNGWNSLSPEERADRLGDDAKISYETAQNQLRNLFDEEYVTEIYKSFKSGHQFESKVNGDRK